MTYDLFWSGSDLGNLQPNEQEEQVRMSPPVTSGGRPARCRTGRGLSDAIAVRHVLVKAGKHKLTHAKEYLHTYTHINMDQY